MIPTPADRALAADYERLRHRPDSAEFRLVSLRMQIRLQCDGPLTTGGWSYAWSRAEGSIIRYPAPRGGKARVMSGSAPDLPVVHTYHTPQPKEVA